MRKLCGWLRTNRNLPPFLPIYFLRQNAMVLCSDATAKTRSTFSQPKMHQMWLGDRARCRASAQRSPYLLAVAGRKGRNKKERERRRAGGKGGEKGHWRREAGAAHPYRSYQKSAPMLASQT